MRERLAIEGARLSHRQNCESMQRVRISPAIGKRRIDSVTRQDVESTAVSVEHDDRTWFFCSEHCRRAFERERGEVRRSSGSAPQRGSR